MTDNQPNTGLKGALAALENKLTSDAVAHRIQTCLPKAAGLNTDRFVQMVVTSCHRTPALLECSGASLLAATIQAAMAGIDIDGVHAALVPYKGEVTYMPMYRGLMHAVRRSGLINVIEAKVVYEGDFFELEYGSQPRLLHRPKLDVSARGAVVGYYAVAHFKDGGCQFDFMAPEEIDAIKSRARAQKGPWRTDYDEMAKKTVLRRLIKFLPVSTETQATAARDEIQERTGETDTSLIVDLEPASNEENGDPLDDLAGELETEENLNGSKE